MGVSYRGFPRCFHTVSAQEQGLEEAGGGVYQAEEMLGGGRISTHRHLSHSAGYFQPLGHDEDVPQIHDEVGRSKEGRLSPGGHRSPARNSGQPEGEHQKQALVYKTKLKSQLLGIPFQLPYAQWPRYRA